MKMKGLHLFFLCIFVFGISMASVNYLWCSNTNFQLIEEEIGSHGAPLAKKNVSLDEEHLSKWLSDYIACKNLFDHGVEVQTHDLIPTSSPVFLSVESPPPDRA